MINPCLSIVRYKKEELVTKDEFYKVKYLFARVHKHIEEIWRGGNEIGETWLIKSDQPKVNQIIVNYMILHPGVNGIFSYEGKLLILYGCVVVFASRLDKKFNQKSFTHFLLDTSFRW